MVISLIKEYSTVISELKKSFLNGIFQCWSWAFAYIDEKQLLFATLLRFTLCSHRPESTGNVNYDITQNKKSSKMLLIKVIGTLLLVRKHSTTFENYPCVQLCSQKCPTIINIINWLIVVHLSMWRHIVNIFQNMNIP